MGPAPSYGTYAQAAQAIYEPQKQAELTQLQATNQMTKNSLESQKGQVSTDYQSAIDKLTQSVQDQTGQINQLYTERLGGNFSGLQGNDLGQMYSRANQQQGLIEQTRANKISEITAGQTNADISYNAGVASLNPKYSSLETQYAQEGYGSAVKDYQDQQYKQQQLALSAARLNQSSYNSAASAAAKSAAGFKVTGKYNSTTGKTDTSQGYAFTGANGQPISMAEYVQGMGGDLNTVLDLLKNGSSYDRNIYNQINSNRGVIQNNPSALLNSIAALDKKNYYGFR